MKKLLTILLSGILIVTSPSLFAGIPVVDAASIAKTVEEGLNRAAEAAKQLEQLKQQYEQAIKYAEEQKKRLEGFTDFSHGFDSTSSYMKDSLSSITNSAKSNLNSLRSQYELSSNVAETQQRYDAILAKIKFYENFNNEMQERAKRLTTLQKEFASADTPQKKADLSNQLNTEKLTMELQLKQYDIAEKQLEAERKAQHEAVVNQLMDRLT
ncbi:conjugal transfer protein TrbJ [Escherichia coli]|uniref:type IV secretion system protein n=1 Tax=Escherichia coli TaxID=562 RepID=UPI0013681F7A|nr:type IV secretion system protein [Escherichia coli]ELH6543596.1 conjugal transfer protein TrbJ [Escherichia coli]ELH6552586.1 conjugal transfer protein TrbJ [Escherichia coli]ELH6581086.1 conjugal transfer protein TrbJ [Escherichia coli]ELH6599682.1 conjugal transfer protein TrbJ [Escherichia coli]ELH6613839.1 conjugal transfer protein TrbJ [Escherichia coli]